MPTHVHDILRKRRAAKTDIELVFCKLKSSQKWLLATYPIVSTDPGVTGWTWRCRRCQCFLEDTDLQLHTCKSIAGKALLPPLDVTEMRQHDLVVATAVSEACALCRCAIGDAMVHSCRGAMYSHTLFDLSDVRVRPTHGVGVSTPNIDLLRNCPGHVVVVVDGNSLQGWAVDAPEMPPGTRYGRCHGYISTTSPLDPINGGFYSLISASGGAGPNRNARKAAPKLAHPFLLRRLYLPYTGVTHTTCPDDIAHEIALLKICAGGEIIIIDPRACGGIAYKLNNSHLRPNAFAVQSGDKAYLTSELALPAGVEVCWCYDAVTDNQSDSQQLCNYGCGGPLIQFVPST